MTAPLPVECVHCGYPGRLVTDPEAGELAVTHPWGACRYPTRAATPSRTRERPCAACGGTGGHSTPHRTGFGRQRATQPRHDPQTTPVDAPGSDTDGLAASSGVMGPGQGAQRGRTALSARPIGEAS